MTPTNDSLPRLIPLKDAAEALGVSTVHTRRLIESGAIRATHLGAKILIAHDEIVRIATEGAGERWTRRKS
jgi:excisionase family DNA binding protein